MCTTNDQGEQVCRNPINVGLYFNDVWAYELDCHREGTTAADTFCGGRRRRPCVVDDDCKDQNFKECILPDSSIGMNYDLKLEVDPAPRRPPRTRTRSRGPV